MAGDTHHSRVDVLVTQRQVDHLRLAVTAVSHRDLDDLRAVKVISAVDGRTGLHAVVARCQQSPVVAVVR